MPREHTHGMQGAALAPPCMAYRLGIGCLRRLTHGPFRSLKMKRPLQSFVSPLIAVEILCGLSIPALFVGTASAHALAPQDGNNLSRSRASGDFVADEIRHHRQAKALPSQGSGYGRAALLPVAIPFVTHFSAVTALVHGK